ncbi:hypothetical protein K505DRAFT_240434 [Melanomma pulvis-pyrius CBS 109.77]|uniref:Uncharacterized protein n=1 Tax=Melanomma pulvis-pyrius CBS 109.77 TaxID=1314802 RepID=A0A6A6XFV3_9PLEO|nr:hypothetical protein K505DRAFT_240434 [Melanomma pulvis-pyrius CBS 109.77]
MAVIWGLDLREMQWSKFGSTYMWNTDYHRRRTKFIVYQIAMICCVVSESLGTAALSDYVDQQDFVSHLNPAVKVHNNDFIGIASYNIFVGVYVATIFGSAFFFDLFWPERHESPSVKMAWRICSVLACLMTLACALAFTIILARNSAYVTGTNAENAQRLLAEYGGSPMRYRDNGRAIASVVFEWPGMIATFASTILLWRSLDYIDTYGPKSSKTRTRDGISKPTDKPLDNGSESVTPPAMEPAHTRPDNPNHATPNVNSAYDGV